MRSVLFIFMSRFFIIDSSLDADDLETLFDNKHCIEASLISTSISESVDNIMLVKVVDAAETLQVAETLNSSTRLTLEKTATSRITELAQYNSIKIEYKLLSENGPPHDRRYVVSLRLGDELYEGSGSSLKKAQQQAADQALTNTFYNRPPEKLKSDNRSQTPTVALNNIAMKLGIAVRYYLLNGEEEHEITRYGNWDQAFGKSKSFNPPNINASEFLIRVPVEDPQITGPFFVSVKVGDSVFKGSGHTVKAARHDAAARAIDGMEQRVLLKDHVCLKEESMVECKKKKESLKSPITRVYEAGQKRNLPVVFTIVTERGKSHQKIFTTQCLLGDFIAEGEGNSKKESKKNAALKMLENVLQLPDFIDQNAIVNGLKSKTKKKKKKSIKQNVKNVFLSYGGILASVWGGDEASIENNENFWRGYTKSGEPKLEVRSAKDKLLQIGNQLNIGVQFTDMNAHNGNYFTLIYLDVKPSHVCLGKGATRERSRDVAALYSIKFLNKLGILHKSEFSVFAKKLELILIDQESTYFSPADFESE